MKNLLFKAAFDGSSFHGWQIQNNAESVQGVLSHAWYLLTGEKPNIIGCSRTDTGVHAKEYYFNVKTESTIPAASFPAALIGYLPGEIALYKCTEVSPEFNARYNCTRKTYEYLFYNSAVLSPFYLSRALHYKYSLDENLMNEAASGFLGEHDFSAFCAAGTSAVSKVRTIYESAVTREGDIVKYTVSGSGFLYNMVRIMAGTLLYVNEGKIKAEKIPEIIEKRSRTEAGSTVPPDGLYLTKVFYGSEIDEA